MTKAVCKGCQGVTTDRVKVALISRHGKHFQCGVCDCTDFEVTVTKDDIHLLPDNEQSEAMAAFCD